MKRIFIGVVAVLLLIVSSGAARAEEAKENKEGRESIEIEAGLKTWYNKWKRSGPAESFTTDSTFLAGPAVEAKYEHVFAEASYLVSTSNYKFTDAGTTTEFDRKDIDIAIGYMFTPEFGVIVGHRNSAIKNKETSSEETNYGHFAGVLGSYPLHDAFSVYGKLTYLLTRLKSDVVSTEAAPGMVAELGVKYAFNKEIAANLGYQFESTKGKGSSTKDTFTGFTLGAMYAF